MHSPTLVHASAAAFIFRMEDRHGRAFAVRLLRSEHAKDPELLARWRSERASQPSRPGHSWGEHPLPWTARPWWKGWTLAELSARLRSRAACMPHDAVFELAQILASQLDELHARGQVHGGLVPEAVLIQRDGRVRLLEAELVDSRRGAPLSVARQAPELLAGEAPSASTDRYNLALLVVELLCGGSPLLRQTREGTIRRVLQGFGALGLPGLDRGSSMWVEACLAREPRHRPQGRLQPLWADIRGERGPGLAALLGRIFTNPPSRATRRPMVASSEANELLEILQSSPLVAIEDWPLPEPAPVDPESGWQLGGLLFETQSP